MSLPKIKHPTFVITLPLSKTKIKFRPILVKEEKIWLLAAQTQDAEDMARAVLQVLQNCLVSPVSLDVGELPTIDVEYFFIKLRSKSINNVLELSFKDGEDNKVYKMEVDLEEIEPDASTPLKDQIDIDGNAGMKLKPPTLNAMLKLLEEKVDINTDNYAVVRECITQIFDKTQTYELKDATKEELDEFIDNFPNDAKEQLKDFYESIPKITYTHKYTNSLGNERSITLNGLADFFMLGSAT